MMKFVLHNMFVPVVLINSVLVRQVMYQFMNISL